MLPGCGAPIRAPAMCADKSEAEHKETAARNKILEDKLVGLEGVMEGALCSSNPTHVYSCARVLFYQCKLLFKWVRARWQRLR